MVRGKKITAALNILEFSNRWAKRPLLKLLNSAIANATHNFNLDKENLYIKSLRVDQGPMLKRWRARAFGRASEIQKRMSHIEMILDELEPGKKPEKETGKDKPAKKEKAEKKDEKKEEKPKKTAKKVSAKEGGKKRTSKS